MMKTVTALLTLLALAALSGPANCVVVDHTYVNNLSSKSTIIATIAYLFPYATSHFINRTITPQTWQADQYSHTDCHFEAGTHDKVELWLQLSHQCNITVGQVDCDQSVVGIDHSDGEGVDIYLSVYGHINEPDGDAMFTIYPYPSCKTDWVG